MSEKVIKMCLIDPGLLKNSKYVLIWEVERPKTFYKQQNDKFIGR